MPDTAVFCFWSGICSLYCGINRIPSIEYPSPGEEPEPDKADCGRPFCYSVCGSDVLSEGGDSVFHLWMVLSGISDNRDYQKGTNQDKPACLPADVSEWVDLMYWVL